MNQSVIQAPFRQKRIKHGFRLIGSGTTPSSPNDDCYNGEIPWVTSAELRETVIINTAQLITQDAFESHSALKLYPPGTLLFAMYGATIGRLGLLGIEACVNQAICALAEPEHFETRFAFYALQASKEELLSLASGGGQPNLNAEKLRDHRLPQPELPEQRAIADFLDREAARLDALVAEKGRWLELLAEKRRALITRAVTRGLNPAAPLRDSGLPWLGQIPAHWQSVRVKFFSHIYYGLSQPPEYQPEGLPFLRATNVKRGLISSEGLVYVDEAALPDSRVVRLQIGDIIVVRSGAYTGDSALVTREWNGAVAGYDMVIRIHKHAMPDFVSHALLCQYILEAQIDPLRQRAAQPHLNSEELGDVAVILPPLPEQHAIVAHISTETAKIDALRAATERTLALLKERRAALIGAAVTGKIEVSQGRR